MAAGLVIGIPLYKNPRLVGTVAQSIENTIIDTDQHIECVFVVDSPEDRVLLLEVERWSSRLSRRLPTTVLVNDANLGFLKSANRIFEFASEKDCDALLLNSDVRLYPNTIQELITVLNSDPMIAFVAPRTNNTTICSFPLPPSDDETLSYSSFAALHKQLPRKSYVPTVAGFCMLCKMAVLKEIGFFDEVYGSGYEEENDLVMRANRIGYCAAIANWAFAYHEGSVSFGRDQETIERRKEHLDLVKARYPEYMEAVLAYDKSPEHRALALLSCAPHEAVRPSLAFDFSSFGCYYNGTHEYGLCVLKAFHQSFGESYSLSAICTEAVWDFFKLGDFVGLEREDPSGERTFSYVVRLGQPFHIASLLQPLQRGAVVLFAMLDPIALDCKYLDVTFKRLHDLWQEVFNHADVVLYISDFVRRQFEDRFDIRDAEQGKVIYLALSPHDYELESNSRGETFDALIIGNHFHHKFVARTARELTQRVPNLRLKVLGTTCEDAESYESGSLAQDKIDELFSSAKVIIFPTHYEGFGIPVVRALGAKRPVLVRPLPPFLEINSRLKSKNVHFYESTDDLVARLKQGIPAWKKEAYGEGVWTWEDCAAAIEQALRERSGKITYGKLVHRLRQCLLLKELDARSRRRPAAAPPPRIVGLLIAITQDPTLIFKMPLRKLKRGLQRQ